MRRVGMILRRLLFPPKWILFLIPSLSFSALAVIFAAGDNESAPAYVIYSLSAYSLVILSLKMPAVIHRLHSAVRNSRFVQNDFYRKYRLDPAFRGSVSILQGMTVNLIYVVFRIIAGIHYASIWFISMAVYYLVLGLLRAYLLICYMHRTPKKEACCYRRTAWLLFLLNISMGGMIVQMVLTNSGYSYPGYLIYVSALFTFYQMTLSVVHLVKYRKIGSPILSAAKVLNVVSAMMSVLGLQTAMIARFSENDESFRRMMNTVTGGIVYGMVILIAIRMLLYGDCTKKLSGRIE